MMTKTLALLAVAAALLAPAAHAAGGAAVALERAPVDPFDQPSLQRGAQIFVNHCLNCHSANAMRYGKLRDIGLTEQQVKDNLMFASEKIGDPMVSILEVKDAKAFFGVVPPDLSLGARSRSPDWIYTYMRSFYRDPASRTGWNNTVFPNVAMPHVLWEYQGSQQLQVTAKMDPNTGDVKETRKLVADAPGRMTPVQYDQYVGDLVNFMAYMAEPAAATRKMWGIVVLFFLGVFFVVALLLKNEYWKDVR